MTETTLAAQAWKLRLADRAESQRLVGISQAHLPNAHNRLSFAWCELVSAYHRINFGDLALSEAHLAEAVGVFWQRGDSRAMALCQFVRAKYLRRAEDFHAAADALAQARTHQHILELDERIELLVDSSTVHRARGRLAGAVADLAEAADALDASGESVNAVEGSYFLGELGSLLIRMRDYAGALALYDDLLPESRTLEVLRGARRGNLIAALLRLGNARRAREEATGLLSSVAELNQPSLISLNFGAAMAACAFAECQDGVGLTHSRARSAQVVETLPQSKRAQAMHKLIEAQVARHAGEHADVLTMLRPYLYELPPGLSTEIASSLYECALSSARQCSDFVEVSRWEAGLHAIESSRHFGQALSTLLTVVGQRHGEWRLTDAERAVVALAARGYEAAEVGVALSLSTHTVTAHIKNARARYGARNTAALVAMTVANGEVTLTADDSERAT